MIEKIPLTNLVGKLSTYDGNADERLPPHHLYKILGFERDTKSPSLCSLYVEDCTIENFFNVPIHYLPDFKEEVLTKVRFVPDYPNSEVEVVPGYKSTNSPYE